jgi:hypothetical protein
MLTSKEELETLIAKAEDTAGTIKPFSIENTLSQLG